MQEEQRKSRSSKSASRRARRGVVVRAGGDGSGGGGGGGAAGDAVPIADPSKGLAYPAHSSRHPPFGVLGSNAVDPHNERDPWSALAVRQGSTVVFLVNPNPAEELVAFMSAERVHRGSAPFIGAGGRATPLTEFAEKLNAKLERRDVRRTDGERHRGAAAAAANNATGATAAATAARLASPRGPLSPRAVGFGDEVGARRDSLVQQHQLLSPGGQAEPQQDGAPSDVLGAEAVAAGPGAAAATVTVTMMGTGASAPTRPLSASAAAAAGGPAAAGPSSSSSSGRRTGDRGAAGARSGADSSAERAGAGSPSAGGDVVGGLPLAPFLQLPRGARETFADTLARAVCTIDRLPKIARIRPRPEDARSPTPDAAADGGGGGGTRGGGDVSFTPERPVCAPVGIFRHQLFSPVSTRRKVPASATGLGSSGFAAAATGTVTVGAADATTPGPAGAAGQQLWSPARPSAARSGGRQQQQQPLDDDDGVSDVSTPASPSGSEEEEDSDAAASPAAQDRSGRTPRDGAAGTPPRRLRRPLTQLVMKYGGDGAATMASSTRDTAASARARSTLFYAPSAVDGTYADIYTDFDAEMRKIRDAHTIFYGQSPTARVRTAARRRQLLCQLLRRHCGSCKLCHIHMIQLQLQLRCGSNCFCRVH